MRIFGWYLLPRDEVIEGLRANVGQLQIKRNRMGARCAQMAEKVQKMKGQVADDQAYIDEIEALLTPEQVAEVRRASKARRGRNSGAATCAPRVSGAASARPKDASKVIS